MSARALRPFVGFVAPALLLTVSAAVWASAGGSDIAGPRISESSLDRITGANEALRSMDGNKVCSSFNTIGAQQPVYCTGPRGTRCIICDIDEVPTVESAIAAGPLDPKSNVQTDNTTKQCNVFVMNYGSCELDPRGRSVSHGWERQPFGN